MKSFLWLLSLVLMIQLVTAFGPNELCTKENIQSHEYFCLGIRDNKTSFQEGGCTLHEGNECDLWIVALTPFEEQIRWFVFILGFKEWAIDFTFSNTRQLVLVPPYFILERGKESGHNGRFRSRKKRSESKL